jgi:hypothetical protein
MGAPGSRSVAESCFPVHGLILTAAPYSTPATELIRFAIGTGPLPERATALWYVLGTNPRTCSTRERRGEPQLAFEGMRQARRPESILAIAAEAYRKLREPLCLAVLLPQPARSAEAATVEDDSFLPETLIRDVPSWAYDVHALFVADRWRGARGVNDAPRFSRAATRDQSPLP